MLVARLILGAGSGIGEAFERGSGVEFEGKGVLITWFQLGAIVRGAAIVIGHGFGSDFEGGNAAACVENSV